jgi:hypothetical protein
VTILIPFLNGIQMIFPPVIKLPNINARFGSVGFVIPIPALVHVLALEYKLPPAVKD